MQLLVKGMGQKGWGPLGDEAERDLELDSVPLADSLTGTALVRG